MTDQYVLQAESLSKSYQDAKGAIRIVDQASLALKAGESIAIIGQSGSGKTTFLNLIAGLDKPDQGEVTLCGYKLFELKERALSRTRSQYLGFVYQFHHLIAELSALDNVSLPAVIAGMQVSQAEAKAKTLLQQVGLSDRGHHRPSELSGGERQRVAIARALINDPSVVLMDEPTGNLDRNTAEQVQDIIQNLSSEHQTAFVIVTHDLGFAMRQDKQLSIENGKLKPYLQV